MRLTGDKACVWSNLGGRVSPDVGAEGEAVHLASVPRGAARGVACCVAPQAGNYLLNSRDSTAQGSELGEGRSPHSLSSCSSLSHLPEGRKNFTNTPPETSGLASLPDPLPAPPPPPLPREGNATDWPRLARRAP